MENWKKVALVGAVSLVTTFGSFTSAFAAPLKTAPAKPIIGVTLMTLTNPYFSTMAKAFQKYAAANGMRAVVEGANNDEQVTLQQVDGFIEQHVAAIVMAPPDATAAVSAVLAANRAGIPVFTVDSNVDMKTLAREGGKIVEYVSSNNYLAGVIAGREMVQYLHGKGNIGWIDFPTAESVQLRDAGFSSVLKKYPRIKVVWRGSGNGSTPGGLTAASEALSGHPDINAFFDINAPCGLGAVDAIKAAHDVGKVAVIGLSGSQAAVKEIANNQVYKFGAMQEPSLEAKTEVQNIKKYLHHGKIPVQVQTAIIKITKQNAHEYFNVAYH